MKKILGFILLLPLGYILIGLPIRHSIWLYWYYVLGKPYMEGGNWSFVGCILLVCYIFVGFIFISAKGYDLLTNRDK